MNGLEGDEVIPAGRPENDTVTGVENPFFAASATIEGGLVVPGDGYECRRANGEGEIRRRRWWPWEEVTHEYQSSPLHAPNVAGLLPESAVSTLIDHAVKMPASDVFFSINDNHVGISVRHLGIVRLLTILTPEQGRRCTSYVVRCLKGNLLEVLSRAR